ncbi:MAG: MBL fold metallo-hydrolase [bacterium]|nr:MBL fold metallo-hydrolase [candidate division KSB1 bacterium]MDH7560155.1 MBL fold metallo-hydrolase [bacterium]
MIVETFVVSLFATNCYLVGCPETKKAALIDPGDEAALLLAAAERLGLTLEVILLTHGHIDHVGAVAEVLERTSCKVCAHRDEVEVLRTLGLQARLFGLSLPDDVKVDVWLSEGDEVRLGSLAFRVLHTPGHTPGSICFYHDGVVFSGDTLFRESVGRTDLPGGSHRSLLASIRSKLLALPDEVQVYPGHGEPTTIGDERRLNPFL